MVSDGTVAILYIPCGSAEEAAYIAHSLLSDRLIACANIYESRSIYRWQGQTADDTEFVIFAKTTASMAEAAARRAEQLHSYQIPCVVTLTGATSNAAFAAWVAGEVSSAGERDEANSRLEG